MWIGIDQSLNATGICRLDENGGVAEILTVKHAVGGAADAKLLSIRRSVISVISGARFVAMEDYSYDSIHRAFDLGEVAGTVKVTLREHEIPYVTVPPATLKMFAAGAGHATKEEMIAAAQASGVTPDDDNQADALFLARVARALTLGCARKRCEMEAVHSLRTRASGKQDKRPRRARRLVKNAI